MGKHFIIVGDFNIHDSLWDENYVGNENLAGREFNQFIEDNDLILPVLEKKIFEGFLPYMGMAAILVM